LIIVICERAEQINRFPQKSRGVKAQSPFFCNVSVVAAFGTTPIGLAAPVKDLRQQGMLNDTLVVWGGEFGRTPMVQGGDDGRDHHPNCFTMWLAGGGVKPAITARCLLPLFP
jgi:uncharacterized protein DUF1501